MTIVIDWLWFVLEVGTTLTVAGLVALLPIIIVCGATCFVVVLLIQRYVAGDNWGASIAKGLAMGVVAGGSRYCGRGCIIGLGWNIQNRDGSKKAVEIGDSAEDNDLLRSECNCGIILAINRAVL